MDGWKDLFSYVLICSESNSRGNIISSHHGVPTFPSGLIKCPSPSRKRLCGLFHLSLSFILPLLQLGIPFDEQNVLPGIKGETLCRAFKRNPYKTIQQFINQ